MKKYDALPTNYAVKEVIDLKENKKQYLFVNVVSLLLGAALIVPMFFFKYSFNVLSVKGIVIILLTVVAMFVVMAAHELVHGLFFKMFGKGKLKFGFHGFAISCSMPTAYFGRTQYLIIGLAPFVLIDVILGVLAIVFYNTDAFLPIYVSLMINFSGCSGDLLVSYKMLRSKKTVLVNDIGVAMTIYDIVPSEVL